MQHECRATYHIPKGFVCQFSIHVFVSFLWKLEKEFSEFKKTVRAFMLRKTGRAICVVIRYQKHSTSKTKGYKLEEKVSIQESLNGILYPTGIQYSGIIPNTC